MKRASPPGSSATLRGLPGAFTNREMADLGGRRNWNFLRQGLEWCAGKLNRYGGFRYQLNGFELRSIDNRSA